MIERERARMRCSGPPEERRGEPEQEEERQAPPEDEVDEASRESFPASDPPSWSPGEAA